jgi:hypothetical protein
MSNRIINSTQVGSRCLIELKGGDMYVMSEKATGYDWKGRSKLTLRHAAGCSKFTTINTPVDVPDVVPDHVHKKVKTSDSESEYYRVKNAVE